MKVLWFTNTPCNAVGHIKDVTIGGGWLQSLDIHMQEQVDLHIAFYANWHEQSFTFGKTTYHVIPADGVRKANLRNILYAYMPTGEDLSHYLDIVERVKPDLIHLHGTENDFGSILPHVQQPVLVSIQGIMAPYAYNMETKHWRELKLHVPRQGRSLKDKVFAKSPYRSFELAHLMGQRETKYMKAMKNFMGRTDWDRRVCSVMSPGSRYFLGDEILRDKFYSLTWSPRRDREVFRIHTTSSDSVIKGFTSVVDAARLLKGAGFRFEWRIAGISNNSSVAHIARKLGGSFDSLGIELLGKVAADALVDKMMEADVFLLPSNIENSPNSLCEAMLMSMPCITTNSGGTPSLLEDGKEGLLIQSGDPWAMAGAIMEVAANYDRAIEMGRNASVRARRRHDPQNVVNQVMNAYKTLLS